VNDRPHTAGRPATWRGVALAIVILLVAATVAATWQARQQIRAAQDSRLAYEATRIDDALEQRMRAYSQVLLGGFALFRGSKAVTLDEWVAYVAALNLSERYPGVKSLSFAPAVPADRLDAFVADVRRTPVPPEFPDPKVFTEFTPRSPTGIPSSPPVHSPILYVAPTTPENVRVIGVDMMQDPTRRAAMEKAASTNRTTLTPKLRLAGEVDESAGFIVYLAVKRKGELLGWLTAAFRAEEFMGGLLGDALPPIDFDIKDDAGKLLYSTAGVYADGAPRPLPDSDGRPSLTRAQNLSGYPWTVRYVASTTFATTADKVTPWATAIAGGVVTLLVLAVTLTGAGWRREALRLASQTEALQKSEAAVRHLATHDPLTGLPNRMLFLERLESALQSTEPTAGFTLAYVDIDGFKAVNDTYGHRAGDELLQAIAGRLLSRVRDTDTVARIGGDEFAILIVDDKSGSDVADVAGDIGNDVVARLGEPYALEAIGDGTTVSIGASVGMALYPYDGSVGDDLVHAADSAMLRAKRSGRGRAALAGSEQLPSSL
jgi:diguanylate cyclase (GGDEF)-like protein